jgi:hypothetical protein
MPHTPSPCDDGPAQTGAAANSSVKKERRRRRIPPDEPQRSGS